MPDLMFNQVLSLIATKPWMKFRNNPDKFGERLKFSSGKLNSIIPDHIVICVVHEY